MVGCVGDNDKEGLNVSLVKPHPDFFTLESKLPNIGDVMYAHNLRVWEIRTGG